MISLSEMQKLNNDLTLEQIEGILYLIYSEKGLTNAELIRKTGLPKETLRRFKSSISDLLVEPDSDNILFKQEFWSDLEKMNLSPHKWCLLEYSDELLAQQLRGIRKEYFLEPKREFDQFFATEETSVAKVKVIKDRSGIKGKRIALLGDDDLLSVVFGLLGDEYAQITVFDIDKDIIDTIEKICRDKGFTNIKTECFDARKSLRPEFIGRFDLFVTDPPYTYNGLKLFLDQGLSLLSTTNSDIYLYYGNSFKTPEKTLQIQELISKYNLLIKDKIENFAQYYGAESIGSASSLYILHTTPSTKSPQDSKITDIYTYQKANYGEFPYVEHYVFKLYDVPQSIVKSKSQLQQSLGKFCQYHKLKVMNTEITRFPGGGFTFNYTLASSNLTVHTWPELKALHFVLVTCSPVQKTEKLYDNLSLLFKTDKIEIEKIE